MCFSFQMFWELFNVICDHKKEKMCLHVVCVTVCVTERDGGERNRERKREGEGFEHFFCTQMKTKNMSYLKAENTVLRHEPVCIKS